jgi:hypothetical protein
MQRNQGRKQRCLAGGAQGDWMGMRKTSGNPSEHQQDLKFPPRKVSRRVTYNSYLPTGGYHCILDNSGSSTGESDDFSFFSFLLLFSQNAFKMMAGDLTTQYLL